MGFTWSSKCTSADRKKLNHSLGAPKTKWNVERIFIVVSSSKWSEENIFDLKMDNSRFRSSSIAISSSFPITTTATAASVSFPNWVNASLFPIWWIRHSVFRLLPVGKSGVRRFTCVVQARDHPMCVWVFVWDRAVAKASSRLGRMCCTRDAQNQETQSLQMTSTNKNSVKFAIQRAAAAVVAVAAAVAIHSVCLLVHRLFSCSI